MYADDTGLNATGLSVSEIETSLNKDLSRFCLWIHANKLSINAVKSKFMLIASPRSVSELADNEKPHLKILTSALASAGLELRLTFYHLRPYLTYITVL